MKRKALRKETGYVDLSKGSMVGALRNTLCKGVREAARAEGKVATEDLAKSLILIRVLGFVPPHQPVITLWARQLLSVEDKPWERLSYH